MDDYLEWIVGPSTRQEEGIVDLKTHSPFSDIVNDRTSLF